MSNKSYPNNSHLHSEITAELLQYKEWLKSLKKNKGLEDYRIIEINKINLIIDNLQDINPNNTRLCLKNFEDKLFGMGKFNHVDKITKLISKIMIC